MHGISKKTIAAPYAPVLIIFRKFSTSIRFPTTGSSDLKLFCDLNQGPLDAAKCLVAQLITSLRRDLQVLNYAIKNEITLNLKH